MVGTVFPYIYYEAPEDVLQRWRSHHCTTAPQDESNGKEENGRSVEKLCCFLAFSTWYEEPLVVLRQQGNEISDGLPEISDGAAVVACIKRSPAAFAPKPTSIEEHRIKTQLKSESVLQLAAALLVVKKKSTIEDLVQAKWWAESVIKQTKQSENPPKPGRNIRRHLKMKRNNSFIYVYIVTGNHPSPQVFLKIAFFWLQRIETWRSIASILRTSYRTRLNNLTSVLGFHRVLRSHAFEAIESAVRGVLFACVYENSSGERSGHSCLWAGSVDPSSRGPRAAYEIPRSWMGV